MDTTHSPRFAIAAALLLAVAGAIAAPKATLRVEDAWSRATPPVAPVAGGFLTVVNAGDKPGDQYIMLRSLLALGKEQRWKDIDAFEQGMSLTAAQSVAAARAHSSFEALPQGQRHALVRIGALLQLLENVLNKGVKMNAASLLSGGTLNISEVASQVEKIIGNAADQEKVENFAKEANRKQFGEAKQALRSFL